MKRREGEERERRMLATLSSTIYHNHNDDDECKKDKNKTPVIMIMIRMDALACHACTHPWPSETPVSGM